MPKLNNRNPKMGKLGNYAVIRYGGKIHYLGKHGTKEALAAYNRFCIELQTNPTGYTIPSGAEDVTVSELCAGYLTHAEETMGVKDFLNCKTAIGGFVLPLFCDYAVDSFSPKSLPVLCQLFSSIPSSRWQDSFGSIMVEICLLPAQ